MTPLIHFCFFSFERLKYVYACFQEAEADRIQVNVSDVMHGWTVQNNFPVVMVTRNGRGQMIVTQQRFLLKGGSSDKL